MRKILVIITTNFAVNDGIATVAMNYYRAIDKTDLRIDFLSRRDNANNELIEEVEQNGGVFYKIPIKKNIFRYIKNLLKIAKDYDVMHIHGNSGTMILECWIGKMAKVSEIITHGHNTSCNHPLLNKILTPMMMKISTFNLTCSEKAGDWLYGKGNYQVLNNAIDLTSFSFNETYRREVRDLLNISENTTVYGHIGSFNEQKNHIFLINVFSEIVKRNKNTLLVLVGEGVKRNEIEKLVNDMNIKKYVKFMGIRNDTYKLLQGFDCFILPSLHEGFPLVLTEAQANGLKCFTSTNVTKEVNIIGNVEYLDLSKGEAIWAEEILSSTIERKATENIIDSFNKKELNIYVEAEKLRNLYLNYNCK